VHFGYVYCDVYPFLLVLIVTGISDSSCYIHFLAGGKDNGLGTQHQRSTIYFGHPDPEDVRSRLHYCAWSNMM
jgi:hypothetical protein